MLTEVLKICEKWPVNVKANIKEQVIKDLVAVSYKFLKLEMQCKKGMHFLFVWFYMYSIHLDIVRWEKGKWGGFCLMDKIC